MALKTDKCIFYHIPKTGGTWVRKVVSELKLGERETASISKGNHSFGLFKKHTIPNDTSSEEKNNLFSFCFVRHPIEWYKSFWNYRIDRTGGQKMYKDGTPDLRFLANAYWKDNFEDFINNMLERFPGGFVTELYQYYVGKDLRGVNFIGRMENLKEDLIKALILAEEDFDENIINKTKRYNTSVDRIGEISKDLEKKILKTEYWVINNFYK